MRLKVARAKLYEILDRSSNDPAYLQQLHDSPVQTLVEVGLPYDLIEDFLRETGWEAEVSGYAIPDCSNTCALTLSSAYPEEFPLG